MAGNKLSVDTDMISSAVRSIHEQLYTIQEAREYITGKALPALDPVWSGPAKDAYTAELAAYTDNFDAFLKVGVALNDALDKARQSYETAEQNAKSKVAALPR